MTENTKKPVVVTPVLRVTRWFFDTPDESKTLPTGMIVGDDKYKVTGFFDPESAEGDAFIKMVAKLLGPKPKMALDQSLPVNGDLPRPVEGIPENWVRIAAKTKFGPVEVIDRKGNAIKNADKVIYAGALMRAAVVFVPYDDPRIRGAKNVSFALKTAVLLEGGEPLSVGIPRVDPRAVFASVIETDVNPLDVPF